MNLINKQYIVFLQRGQYACQIARLVEHRAGGHLKANAQLIRYNVGKCRLTQSGRTMQQHMIQRLLSHTGSHDEYLQVLHHLRLSTEIVERKRPKRILILPLTFWQACFSDVKFFFHTVFSTIAKINKTCGFLISNKSEIHPVVWKQKSKIFPLPPMSYWKTYYTFAHYLTKSEKYHDTKVYAVLRG